MPDGVGCVIVNAEKAKTYQNIQRHDEQVHLITITRCGSDLNGAELSMQIEVQSQN
jgi:hypothetical protein